jgi:CheY-like chemotaxis protein
MAKESRDRVLIADDNEANVELLEAYLSDMDVETAVAVDGQDTLDKAASFDPHLILLDVMMLVTALNEHGDMERAVESGTDDFLSKPVNKEALVKRVENMLKLRTVTDELERLRRYIEEMEGER